MPFETNVFINCPFDKNYKPILRAIIFSATYAGLSPVISSNTSSGTVRIQQIKEHIRDSKYGIHDLSRSRPLNAGDIPRFNMPYELGIDIGCLEYGNELQRTKSIVILETEQFHYQKVLSDISGQDIARHNDDPQLTMKCVRDWLVNNGFDLPGTARIWIAFNSFNLDVQTNLADRFTKAELRAMPESEYIRYAREWMNEFFEG